MTKKYTQLFPVKALYGECSIEECDTILSDNALLQEYLHLDSTRSTLASIGYTPSDAVVDATLDKCFEGLGMMLHH